MFYIVLPDGTVSKVVHTDEQGNSLRTLDIVRLLRELVDSYRSN